MNAAGHWFSRITPKPEIGYKQMVGLGDLDPYGQHQTLCRLFDLPPKETRTGQPAPFLFRAEQQDGLPVFYVLSEQRPQNRQDLWRIEAKAYAPDIRAGDRLAFKLRGNPTVTRHTAGERGRRHDVVMDAKQRMGWKNLPEASRPSLAHLAYEAGICWLRDRRERLGVQFGDADLRVDGYRTWQQRNGKGIALSTLDFEGHFRIIDPTRFLNALLGGIGPAKAFGCGLLLVRRV
ncbi:MAG: type I-E CRISPR-associated protein Cas6/Cse3/CasE [Acidithiobacillus sp.]